MAILGPSSRIGLPTIWRKNTYTYLFAGISHVTRSIRFMGSKTREKLIALKDDNVQGQLPEPILKPNGNYRNNNLILIVHDTRPFCLVKFQPQTKVVGRFVLLLVLAPP